MSIWHDDTIFPDDKRYWLAFINVRRNGNKFWKVSWHLADFIEDVSGAGFKVCNTKIEKWCYLDDLFAQETKINRLREALQSIKQQTINLEDYEEIGAIATISDICDKTLNSEKEEK